MTVWVLISNSKLVPSRQFFGPQAGPGGCTCCPAVLHGRQETSSSHSGVHCCAARGPSERADGMALHQICCTSSFEDRRRPTAQLIAYAIRDFFCGRDRRNLSLLSRPLSGPFPVSRGDSAAVTTSISGWCSPQWYPLLLPHTLCLRVAGSRVTSLPRTHADRVCATNNTAGCPPGKGHNISVFLTRVSFFTSHSAVQWRCNQTLSSCELTNARLCKCRCCSQRRDRRVYGSSL